MSQIALTPEEREAMDQRIADVLDLGHSEPDPRTKLFDVPIPEAAERRSEDGYYFGALRTLRTKRVPHLTYVIRSAPFVKIGTASDVEKRFRSMLAMNPHPVEMVAIFAGGQEFERELHIRFKTCRHRDEWFREEGELAAWIAEGCPI